MASSKKVRDLCLARIGDGHTESTNYYGFGADWCAMFVSMIMSKAGYKSIAPQSGLADDFYNGASAYGGKTHGPNTTPEPGWIATFDYNYNGVANHVAIVVKVENGRITTVGGNEGPNDWPYSNVGTKEFSIGGTEYALMGYYEPPYPQSDWVASGDTGTPAGPPSIDFDDYLGEVFVHFEVGDGSDPGMISNGNDWGDPGGTSYGLPQYSTNMGSAEAFANWFAKELSSYPLAVQLGNATPDTAEFNSLWKSINSDLGAGTFGWYQLKYSWEKFYTPFVNRVSAETGIDINSNRALQEAAWSIAVQYGPATPVWTDSGIKGGMSPTQIINQLYDYKIATAGTRWFVGLREMAVNRFTAEREMVLQYINEPGRTFDTASGGGTGEGSGGVSVIDMPDTSAPIIIERPKPVPTPPHRSDRPSDVYKFLKGINIFRSMDKIRSNEFRITEYISVTVTEKAIGEFTFALTLPPLDRYRGIEEGMLISIPYIHRVRPTGTNTHQIFQIDRIEREVGANNSIVLTGQHITNSGLANYSRGCFPANAELNAALKLLSDSLIDPNPIKLWSDVDTTATIEWSGDPRPILLGTDDKSVNRLWPFGTMVRDNTQIEWTLAGSISSYVAKLGHNMDSIRETIDRSGIVYTVIPYMNIGENKVLKLPELYIESPLKNGQKGNYLELEVKPEQPFTDNESAFRYMREKVQELFDKFNIDKPKVTYDINVVDLGRTEEYKDLAKYLRGFDINRVIQVDLRKLGYKDPVSLKVISITWDGQKITGIEVGSVKEVQSYTPAGIALNMANEIKTIKAVIQNDRNGKITIGDNFAQTVFNYKDEGGQAFFIGDQLTARSTGNAQYMYVEGKQMTEIFTGKNSDGSISFTIRTDGDSIRIQVNDGCGFYADRTKAGIVMPDGKFRTL